MPKRKIYSLYSVLLIAFFLVAGCKEKTKLESYTCPMHPEVLSDSQGSCPICKMDLVSIPKREDHAQRENKQAEVGKSESYTCPMHPEVLSESPGSCPICKMDLVPMSKGEDHDYRENRQVEASKSESYTCPMHPEVLSESPGSCPICKMDLVSMSKGEDHSRRLSEHDRNIIFVEGSQQKLAGIRVEKVIKQSMKRTIKAPGALMVTEDRVKVISSKFDGRIEKLFLNQTGIYVNEKDPLFETYSPSLIKAQSDYLITLNTVEKGDTLMKHASEEKLRQMGLTNSQIKNIENSRQLSMAMKYFSSVRGVITKKRVKEGQYFKEGDVLYEVSDFSTLWNVMDLNEHDVMHVSVGQEVRVVIHGSSYEEVRGFVTFIYPVINQTTRSVKVRVDVPNYKGQLKPNMFTTAYINTKVNHGIFVDQDAVIFTGKDSYVWVMEDKNHFSPRSVKIGEKSDFKYHIVNGLKEGEFIAVSGGFFLDAEKTLRNVHIH